GWRSGLTRERWPAWPGPCWCACGNGAPWSLSLVSRSTGICTGSIAPMSESQTRTSTRARILRRIVKTVAVVAVIVALFALGGLVVVWGHFWDFRLGDPTSESCTNCHTMEEYVDSQTNA